MVLVDRGEYHTVHDELVTAERVTGFRRGELLLAMRKGKLYQADGLR